MPLSSYKTKKRLRFVFIAYWFLLAYIVAALIWWFIELNNQNKQITNTAIQQLKKDEPGYFEKGRQLLDREKRKTIQYIGEGSVFFLVIMAGAFFIFRSVKRQLKLAQQQQNFMMAITHELKTPIAITKLNLETLLKRKLDETQSHKLVQKSIAETDRLNSLCNNILLLAQLEDRRYIITREEINLSELVNESIKDFYNRYPERSYAANIANDVYIKGDRLLLQLALNNLIDNATRYSPKEATVGITLQKEAGKIKLAVQNEGSGINDAEKKKVFEKFYRLGNKATKEARGTGLGLYLTKKIVLQHKAQISVSDNLPAGSIFTIEFLA